MYSARSVFAPGLFFCRSHGAPTPNKKSVFPLSVGVSAFTCVILALVARIQNLDVGLVTWIA